MDFVSKDLADREGSLQSDVETVSPSQPGEVDAGCDITDHPVHPVPLDLRSSEQVSLGSSQGSIAASSPSTTASGFEDAATPMSQVLFAD